MSNEVATTEPDTKDPPIAWRSVSQLNEHDKCGYRYRLNRIDKAWRKPAAWLPQGLGVHEAVESFEKSERTMTLPQMEDVFTESYAKHTNRLAEDVPNFRYWFRSGPYDGEADIERRYGIGIEQVAKYKAYTEKKPEETPFRFDDGSLCVEWPFEMEVGGVPVRGYVDAIVWDSELKQWVARDVKTGKSPGDEKQLAVYGIAFEKATGIEIDHGDYWMARTGKPTIPYDLTEWPEQRVAEEFQRLDEAVKAEVFEPDPEPDKCRFCDVNTACEFAAAVSF